MGLGLGKVGLAPLMGVEREEVKGWGIKDEGLRMKRREGWGNNKNLSGWK